MPAAIPDVLIICPNRIRDHRGYFSETYNKRVLEAAGIESRFVQDNESLSVRTGAVRGLHFQMPPFDQDKLVRVLQGAVFDVAVDIRQSSPTFGQHISAVLSAESGHQIFIPSGFAHGFCTLEPNTVIFYKVTNYYSPEHDEGIHWSDPDLGIEWPVDPKDVTISDKDEAYPRLRDLPKDVLFDFGNGVKD